jgi:hypothetical protein
LCSSLNFRQGGSDRCTVSIRNKYGAILIKAEIIARTLRELGLISRVNDPPSVGQQEDEEEFVISVLLDLLPEGMDIWVCKDFVHLAVECCATCHNLYPHYDMVLINLPHAGKAWVCHAVRLSLFPEPAQGKIAFANLRQVELITNAQ